MAELYVETIVNSPVNSNCYILYQNHHKNCLIIDPGSSDASQIQEFLVHKGLKPNFIILTHHHFDHIWSVNKLRVDYDVKVICSRVSSKHIIDKKLNLSSYYDDIGFELNPAEVLVEEINYCFEWHGIVMNFFNTVGHSQGCISMLVENYLFTGDALLKDFRTVTKLPGGDKLLLAKTFSFFYDLLRINKELVVYPGHGKTFKLEEKKILLKSNYIKITSPILDNG